jgi:diketogulonate reductase-like aldo/keto reductase
VSLTTRPIPASGERLPVVGLGTWQQFDVPSGSSRRPQLAAVLRALRTAGGSVIDASPMYGQAEARVGELLAEAGWTDAFVATKVWTQGRRAGATQMAQSRALLGGRVDLMQVHNLVDLEAHAETLLEMKATGEIRYWGITHYTSAALPDLERAIERHRPDFVQLAYSIGVRDAEARTLPLAAERGVAVLVNRPLEGGGLMRRLRGRGLPAWALDFGAESWSQFFLKYILGHPAVTCVIPGTDDPAHMADNLAAGGGRMPDEAERRRMAALWDEVG